MIPVTNYSDFAFYTELAVLILLLFWDSDFAYYTLAVLGGFNMDLWSGVSYQVKLMFELKVRIRNYW